MPQQHDDEREAETPALRWLRENQAGVVEAFPWLAAALLALLLAAQGGAGAFGLALGLEGTALAVWAAYVALRAAREGRELRRAVADVHATAAAIRAGVAELNASTRRAEQLGDRLLAREELDCLRAIDDALLHLGAAALELPRPQPAPPPEPVILAGPERLKHHDRLYPAMRDADGFELPACTELLDHLSPLRAIILKFGGTGPHPDTLDFRPYIRAAQEEVGREMGARRARLRPGRPA